MNRFFKKRLGQKHSYHLSFRKNKRLAKLFDAIEEDRLSGRRWLESGERVKK